MAMASQIRCRSVDPCESFHTLSLNGQFLLRESSHFLLVLWTASVLGERGVVRRSDAHRSINKENPQLVTATDIPQGVLFQNTKLLHRKITRVNGLRGLDRC